jgi:hypothetical protein
VPNRSADDWLHLVLGIGLLGSWFVTREPGGMPAERPTAP